MNSDSLKSFKERFHAGLASSSTQASLALLGMFMIYWTLSLTEVLRVEGLFSFDPWYHLAVSEEVIIQQGMVYGFEYYSGYVPVDYPTSMWILISSLHQLSGVDLLVLFKILGLFARTVTALVLYVVAAHVLSHRGSAVIAPALFLASPYVFLRGLLTFPENFALIFIMLAFYALLRSLELRKPTTFLALVLAAHLYVHYRSAFISFSLLIVVLGYALSKKIFVLKQVSLFLAQLLLFALPIIGFAAHQYYLYSIGIIGEGAYWAPFATGPRYQPPPLEVYISRIGVLAIALAAVGSATVLWRPRAVGFLCLFWAGLAIIATRGAELQIYVPTDRMFAYLVPPLAVLGAIGVRFLISRVEKPSLRFTTLAGVIISGAVVSSMLVVLPDVHGWSAFSEPELEAVEWLNDNVIDGEVVAIAGATLLPYYLSERKQSIDIARLDYWEQQVNERPDLLWSLLNTTYPNSVVYLVVKRGVSLPYPTEVFVNAKIHIHEFPT